MGEKSPFLVIYLFTFLAARPLFSSLTAARRQQEIDDVRADIGLRRVLLIDCTSSGAVEKNTYSHTVCVQEPKNKNYGASSVIFTALGRCAAAIYRGKGAIIYVSRY
jgi:hypothetical protein